jgi:hypothetical protein
MHKPEPYRRPQNIAIVFNWIISQLQVTAGAAQGLGRPSMAESDTPTRGSAPIAATRIEPAQRRPDGRE